MLGHKINIDSSDILLDKESTFYLNIDKFTELNILVQSGISTRLIIIGNSNYNLHITLQKDANLTVNSINRNNSVNIKISLYEKAMITYNHSVTCNSDSINNFNITHQEKNSTSVINNNGVNLSNEKLFFNIDGIIPKHLTSISCSQNSKIINYQNGNSKIIPNLIIDSNDIVANHSAYIGIIDEEEKFYLKSRGISEQKIEKLIYKATLLGKMNLYEEKEEFNRIIDEWW